MNSKKHHDVVIIGAGIVGAATAYYCSKNGIDITVLEKGDIASGTSSRCDGNILAIDNDPGFDSQMALKSQELVSELSKELELPFEYRRTGSILVCENDMEMELAEQWVEKQRNAGLDFKMLDRADLRDESKYLADDLPGGLECPTDSTINPYLLAYSLINGAKKYGANIHVNTEVLTIRKIGEQFEITTNHGLLTANKVVNTSGVWSPHIGNMLGIDIPIVPRKGHIIVAGREEPIGLRAMMEFGYLGSKFGSERDVDSLTEKYGVAMVFEPTESQNFLIGSSREFVGYDTVVNHEVIRTIARRFTRFFPKVNAMKVIRAYAGLRPWTPDHLPIISEVEEVPGFYIAAGHEGDGIGLSPITGKLIEQIINEKETIIPIEPLRFSRFKERVTSI